MEAHPVIFGLRQVPVLLRGEPKAIAQSLERWEARSVLLYVAVILAGAGLYGAAMGWWRGPDQALYTAIKFPLVILLTTLGNSLLNGMLAPLLGLNLRFRQSLLAMNEPTPIPPTIPTQPPQSFVLVLDSVFFSRGLAGHHLVLSTA